MSASEIQPLLMVVDDETSNRELLRRRLERCGYDVMCATSGHEAMSLLDARVPELLLLDIRMPGMSGLEVLSEVRRTHTQTELPVIMVTAEPGSETAVLALDLGANDYVTKPVDFPLALARIRTQLALRRAVGDLRVSEERYALAANGSRDGLWDWDMASRRVFFSPRWKAQLGYGETELSDDPGEWFQRVHPEDLVRLQADIAAHSSGKAPHFENEHRIRRKDGVFRWMLSCGLALRDKAGRPVRMVGSQTDVTVGKTADPLTGLASRLLLVDRLERAVMRSKRDRCGLFAVLLLDVDRFKRVNDGLGPAVGDELLRQMATRLRNCLREEDTVARGAWPEDGMVLSRLGGDEFAVLVEGVRNVGDVLKVTERIRESLLEPCMVSGHEMTLTASIGIALSSEGYDRPEDILRDADTAMYFAKESGRSGFAIFDGAMRTRAVQRLQMEADLRHGLERGELELFYQPILSLADRKLRGFEALVRWRHPSRGLIHPGEFIPLAEDSGLILPLGRWIFEEACRQLSEWQDIADPDDPLTLHVNFSARQLVQGDLAKQIAETLHRYGVDTSRVRVKLEITETAMLEKSSSVQELLKRLGEMAVGVSIDDFGTGYSSLSQLQRFPVQTLKVDRSFVSRLPHTDSLEIIRTIIGLAHQLGMDLIAEGVETEDQASQLQKLGCEFAQGYHFSVPVDAKAASGLLEARYPRLLEAAATL